MWGWNSLSWTRCDVQQDSWLVIFGIKQAPAWVDSWVYSMWECDLLDLELLQWVTEVLQNNWTYLEARSLPQNSLGQSTVWASCRWTRTRAARFGHGQQPLGCWSLSGLSGSFWKAGRWCARRRSETRPRTSPAEDKNRAKQEIIDILHPTMKVDTSSQTTNIDLLPPPREEGMWQPAMVCHSVLDCGQDTLRSDFSEGVDNGPRNSWLDFGNVEDTAYYKY